MKRALELLEVGGRLVYSTCSLNPVEDEAVIQRMILDAGKENVVIEEASEMVPGIHRFFCEIDFTKKLYNNSQFLFQLFFQD